MSTQFLKSKSSKVLLLVMLSLPIALSQIIAGCTYSKPLSAKEVDMGNLLTWSTSEEVSTDNFQIQKSEDGIFFSSIGEVEASGTSVGGKSYRFLDPAIGDRKVYYRLLQMDIDGRSAFTHIAVLNKENKNDYLITMMGNTTTERYFNLVLNSKVTGLMNYRIENLDKKLLKTGDSNVIEGANLLSLDLDKLPDDKYLCVFQMNEEEERIYLVKGQKEPMVGKE